MTIGRKGKVVGIAGGAMAFLLGLVGIAKAGPPGGPSTATGDPSTGIVLVLIDRSGSMHDLGMDCYDEGGNPITTPIRKWECAVKFAKLRIKNGDSGKTKRYFLWAFGTLVYDPTYTELVWSIDKNGQPLRDGLGNTLPAAISDSVAMNYTDVMAALDALDVPAQGPTDNDAGTPLAGAYCTGIQKLLAYRYPRTEYLLSVQLASDGLENATPSGVVCQGVDSVAAGYPYAQGNADIADLTYDTTGNYVLTADGLLVPSWQSNTLDMSVSGACHVPDATGKVASSSGAFVMPDGLNNVVTNITFLKDFVQTPLRASVAGIDRPPVRASMANALSDDLDYFRGIAEITGGRLISFGDGATPAPGDPTAMHLLPGDINDSGCVDAVDYAILLQLYGKKVTPNQPETYAADINVDARIDINDYMMMSANWGHGCATPPPPIPVPQQSVFGFETLTTWSSQAPLSLTGSPKTEGTLALSVGGSGNRPIRSSVFSTKSFQGVTSKLALDVALPANVSNKYWTGQVQVFANCPSGNVWNWALGNVDLTGKPLGQFSTIKFAIPPQVKAAMTTVHPDFSFTIVLNANDAGYVFDNLRFVP